MIRALISTLGPKVPFQARSPSTLSCSLEEWEHSSSPMTVKLEQDSGEAHPSDSACRLFLTLAGFELSFISLHNRFTGQILPHKVLCGGPRMWLVFLFSQRDLWVPVGVTTRGSSQRSLGFLTRLWVSSEGNLRTEVRETVITFSPEWGRGGFPKPSVNWAFEWSQIHRWPSTWTLEPFSSSS